MPHHLAGIAELAERWSGISRQAAQEATRRAGFPEPNMRLRQGPVWLVEDVQVWEQAERDAGRPLPGERPRGPRRQQRERDA